MKKRRILALLLCAAMLCSMSGAAVYADEATEQTQSEPVIVGEQTTSIPTEAPTEAPAEKPTEAPSDDPTEPPASNSTEEPTDGPSDEPSEEPTVAPTDEPVEEPTESPTDEPVEEPTEEPTDEPTEEPTGEPTEEPAEEPTEETTVEPTEEPTEVGDLVTDELMVSAMSLDVPMAIESIVEPPHVSISYGQYSHGGACCPGSTVTFSSSAEIASVSIDGSSQPVNAYSFSYTVTESKDYSFDFTFTDSELPHVPKTVRASHGQLTLDTQKVSEATCTEPGKSLSLFRCGVCWALLHERASTEIVPAKGHDYEGQPEVEIDDSDCGGGKLTVQYCKVCGYMKVPEGSSLAEGHVWGDVETKKQPTCSTGGERYRTCTKCGMQDPATYVALPPDQTKHNWGPWDIPQSALTCGEKVTATRKCLDCQAEDSFTYESTAAHKFTEWRITREATCTETGLEECFCSVCDAKSGATRTIAKLNHEWEPDPEHETKQPDCVNSGMEYKVCKKCDSKEENVIPPRGHTPDVNGGYASSEEGHWRLCLVCKQPVRDPEPHAYALKDCEKGEVCTTCGFVNESSRKPHDWEWTKIAKYTHEAKCKNCNARITGEYHTFVATSDCSQPRTCTKCGYEKDGFKYHEVNGCWVDGAYVRDTYRYADETRHYQECGNIEGCTYKKYSAHIVTNHDCTAGDIKCDVCGHVFIPKQTEHAFGAPSHTGEASGTVACTNPGCTVTQENPHKLATKVEITEATCTVSGKKVTYQYCTGGCGYETEHVEEVIPPLGHAWTDYADVTTSTCQAGGVQERHCTRCSIQEMKNVDKSAHPGSTLKVLKEATCTTDGSQALVCTVCGVELESAQTIPALGHKLVESGVKTAASCNTDKVIYQKCVNPGCDYTCEAVVEGSRLGHNFAEYQYQGDATCMKDGSEKATCDRCGAVDVRVKANSKLEHVYAHDDDCTTAGECIYGCGTKSEAAPAHVPAGNWLVNPLTDEHYKLCGNEGCAQIAVIEAHKPAADDSDCTTPILCTVCKAEVEPANTAHDFASWEDNGKGGHVSECANENCTATSTEAHDFMSYIYNDDAACEQDGTETATCLKCGATDIRTAVGTALEHAVDPNVPSEFVDPTCTEGGYTTYTCVRCGKPFQTDFIDPLGHELDEDIEPVVTAPTCTEGGYTTYTCARCGEGYQDDFTPAAGHTPVYEGSKAATCTEAGYKGGSRCSVCGTTLSARTTLGALGHSFGAWTASGGGQHSVRCARCGATRTERCSYSEIRVGDAVVHVCKVCGDVVDPTNGETVAAASFEIVTGATAVAVDEGAMPAGELVVRKLDIPFGEELNVLEAFTVACELDGEVIQLRGRIRVTMPVSCQMPFRLIRVDEVENSETGETEEKWVELEFEYANGTITFETDRDGMFLLTPLDEEA